MKTTSSAISMAQMQQQQQYHHYHQRQHIVCLLLKYSIKYTPFIYVVVLRWMYCSPCYSLDFCIVDRLLYECAVSFFEKLYSFVCVCPILLMQFVMLANSIPMFQCFLFRFDCFCSSWSMLVLSFDFLCFFLFIHSFSRSVDRSVGRLFSTTSTSHSVCICSLDHFHSHFESISSKRAKERENSESVFCICQINVFVCFTWHRIR